MKNLAYQTKTLILAAFLSGSLIISGCKKESKAPAPVQKTVIGPFLYVGGYTQSGGTYLKISLSDPNAAITSQSIANTKQVSSIITSGSDIYMAAQTNGYWKNSVFVPINGALSISFLSLAGTSVYAAGFDNSSNVAYWANNTEVDLSNTFGRNLFPYQGVSTYSLTGIAASGNAAFVSGQLFTQNEPGSPASAASGDFGMLWQNGSLQLLGKGDLVNAAYNSTAGIAVSGSDVYVAGRMPDATYAGGYWKNGLWNAINNGAFMPSAITSSGTDVYISGYTFDAVTRGNPQGVYWKNGALINLSGAQNATGVIANGSDVYAIGVDSNNNEVIWKNGVAFKTIGPLGSSIVPLCMAVGN